MAYSHLINCVVLAIGPYLCLHQAKQVTNLWRIALITALGYLLMTTFKVT